MKNLTLRQRILASFLVIVAIMTMMVVVDYRRLLHVEAEVEMINNDAGHLLQHVDPVGLVGRLCGGAGRIQ